MERFLNKIICGDCLEVLKTMPDNSIDSCVTDPPYELGFMGKSWDSTGIAYDVDMWREVSRVLKPGGYLLSFGGTRTYHRMVCAIEDAGFEIRDQIQWIYGSGFPKSMDIAKSIEAKILTGSANKDKFKQLDGEKALAQLGYTKTHADNDRPNNYNGQEYNAKVYFHTPEAQQWNGWGTALKPAHEPIVVARKPLSEKTVADNVLKWGTGGINIDGCRVETNEIITNHSRGAESALSKGKYGDSKEQKTHQTKGQAQGRFPANVIFDEEAGKMLDEQSGITKSGKVKENKDGYEGESNTKFLRGRSTKQNQHGDSGGASRFFYCAKASKKEREGSKHPTVKPLMLMRYLVRLVTPLNGIVLEPFAGSGTTLEASSLEGFSFVGIEKQAEYIPDIKARIYRARLEAKGQISLFG